MPPCAPGAQPLEAQRRAAPTATHHKRVPSCGACNAPKPPGAPKTHVIKRNLPPKTNLPQADFYENHLFISLARFSIKSPSTLGIDGSAHASRGASFAAPVGPGGARGRSAWELGGGRAAVHPSRPVALRGDLRSRLLHSSSAPRTSWLRGASATGAEGPAELQASFAAAAAAAAPGAVLPMELTVQQVGGGRVVGRGGSRGAVLRRGWAAGVDRAGGWAA